MSDHRREPTVPYTETRTITAKGEEFLRQTTCPPNLRHGGPVAFMTEDRYPRCPVCGRYQ